MTRTAEAPAAAAKPRKPWVIRSLAIPLVLFALFAVAPPLIIASGETYLLSIFTRILIFAIAAVSLDLILGYGAMVSLGHAAFIGIGAYVVGIMAFHGVSDAFLQLAVVLLACSLFGLVTGAISLKTRGVYFIMITLAFAQMAYFTTTSLAMYGGDDGLTLRARSTVFGISVLADRTVLYYVAFGILVGVFFLCRALVASRFGRVLQGCRQSPLRMQSIGFSPYRYQLVAYVISGMIAGVAGALLANQFAFVSPAYMSWHRSAELIFMVLLGGMGSLYGAIIGAVAFRGVEEILSHFTHHWRVIFGPLLILAVLFARGGLISLFRPGRRDG
jgi:branched-chain amino acid transport system permease protein